MSVESDQDEVWVTHPEFTGYEVSNMGRVRSVDRVVTTRSGAVQQWRGRVLKATGPYPYVTLCDAGRERVVRVHTLVLQAFVGPRPPGMQCRHLDGNKKNSRLDNLAWGTSTENMADKTRHGTAQRGERNPFARLDASAVLYVREQFAAGRSQISIAVELGVSHTCIYDIVAGRTWKHL